MTTTCTEPARDGPLPGQSFEAWREQLQGEYYKPPAA